MIQRILGFYDSWWFYPEDKYNHRVGIDAPEEQKDTGPLFEKTLCGKVYNLSHKFANPEVDNCPDCISEEQKHVSLGT